MVLLCWTLRNKQQEVQQVVKLLRIRGTKNSNITSATSCWPFPPTLMPMSRLGGTKAEELLKQLRAGSRLQEDRHGRAPDPKPETGAGSTLPGLAGLRCTQGRVMKGLSMGQQTNWGRSASLQRHCSTGATAVACSGRTRYSRRHVDQTGQGFKRLQDALLRRQGRP